MAFVTVTPEQAESYPPNVQSILKRPSGPSAFLGLEIQEVDVEGARVRAVFNATEQVCNKWGGIHGGMVAAMLDDLMSLAVGLSLEWGEITPTLEMKTSFIAAGRPGRLQGEGWVIKRGRSVAFIEANLHDGAGALIATASSTARIVQTKPDKKQG